MRSPQQQQHQRKDSSHDEASEHWDASRGGDRCRRSGPVLERRHNTHGSDDRGSGYYRQTPDTDELCRSCKAHNSSRCLLWLWRGGGSSGALCCCSSSSCGCSTSSCGCSSAVLRPAPMRVLPLPALLLGEAEARANTHSAHSAKAAAIRPLRSARRTDALGKESNNRVGDT